MSLISIHNLRLGFGKNVTISEANFEISDGDFICIVGANGSGKTTLIKAILGLVSPISGTIRFGDGITLTDIGYLPQELNLEQNFPALVSEVVLSGCLSKMHRRICYNKLEQQKMQEVLRRLGILKLKDVSFNELSGGQKQKVLLARALVSEPKLLILDEPSNNLDHESREGFYQILTELNRTKKITILMVTHDLDKKDLIGNKIVAIEGAEAKLFATEKYLGRFK
ncbi:ATP-binding cassette domain-containing protein [Candidatus Saccharibacteria bacterium]|nr:ATP-binding cassette domain-containing protein [Candidatus Saccharibacteria bacterium]